MVNKQSFKRRDFLKSIGLVGCGSFIPGVINALEAKENRTEVLRIANITDVHLDSKHNAPQRFRSCLEKIKEHQVDFFLNGGDSIMAADYDHITRQQVISMWNLWKDSIEPISEYEMYSCLGNHDMWWAAPDQNDPMYGKRFAMDQLNMPALFYSFDKAGWHFIVLDSNNDGGGALGKEQLQWLDADLGKLSRNSPVLVMSHYPLLSACTHTVGGNHKDSLPITKVFFQHRDKKISCISGHVHLQDTVVYDKVHYFCNGAVSGYWWGDGDEQSAGKHWYHQTPPGYAILDLFEDGTVINNYYTYKS